MIEFKQHVLEQMEERSVAKEEVLRVIEHGEPSDAREPRYGRAMVFTEGYHWKGRYYPHKRVRVILAREPGKVVVVTVYSYYGRWEVKK